MQYLRQSAESDEKAFFRPLGAAAVYRLATRCNTALQWSMMKLRPILLLAAASLAAQSPYPASEIRLTWDEGVVKVGPGSGP